MKKLIALISLSLNLSTNIYAMENDQNRFEAIQVYEGEGHLITRDSFSHLKPTVNVTIMGNIKSNLPEYYETHEEAKIKNPDWKMFQIQTILSGMCEDEAERKKKALQDQERAKNKTMKDKSTHCKNSNPFSACCIS